VFPRFAREIEAVAGVAGITAEQCAALHFAKMCVEKMKAAAIKILFWLMLKDLLILRDVKRYRSFGEVQDSGRVGPAELQDHHAVGCASRHR
jgi:hypothetical protein